MRKGYAAVPEEYQEEGMKRLIGVVICLCIYMLIGHKIRAEDTGRLEVNITQEDGQSVMVKPDHHFYTAVPVIFTLPDNGGDSYYSISTDNGNSFGAYVRIDSGTVKLYPDDKTAPDGKWQIMFANVSEGQE